jgi:glycosyltransferase involved in cell wall biosynthesis
MSSGCPVVCSDIPSSKEVSGYEGHDMFALGDKDKLVSLMLNFLDNPISREAVIKYGYKRIDAFGWGKMAREVHDLYMKV